MIGEEHSVRTLQPQNAGGVRRAVDDATIGTRSEHDGTDLGRQAKPVVEIDADGKRRTIGREDGGVTAARTSPPRRRSPIIRLAPGSAGTAGSSGPSEIGGPCVRRHKQRAEAGRDWRNPSVGHASTVRKRTAAKYRVKFSPSSTPRTPTGSWANHPMDPIGGKAFTHTRNK